MLIINYESQIESLSLNLTKLPYKIYQLFAKQDVLCLLTIIKKSEFVTHIQGLFTGKTGVSPCPCTLRKNYLDKRKTLRKIEKIPDFGGFASETHIVKEFLIICIFLSNGGKNFVNFTKMCFFY